MRIVISVDIDGAGCYGKDFFKEVSQFLIHNYSTDKKVPSGKIFVMKDEYPLYFLPDDVRKVVDIKWE